MNRGLVVVFLIQFIVAISECYASSSIPSESALNGISFDVPKVWPCEELSCDGVKALWLEGEKFNGKPTWVFAYLAMPTNVDKSAKVPGMVLAHGGAGTAYRTWASRWAKRGYAAIVVDNCGAIPVRGPGAKKWIRSEVGGPDGWGRFDLALKPASEQWPYHAVGALVRAHSYLRSLNAVDKDRTGITGVSWGGYLTVLTSSFDKRFKLAMPVYACGFYDEMIRYTRFYERDMTMNKEATARWCELFDSKHYAARMDLPVFWFASSNDAAFPFDLLQKTLRLPKKRPLAAIRVRMAHSHGPAGENMPELYMFADHIFNDGPRLPEVSEPELENGEIKVEFNMYSYALKRVDLNWTKAEVLDKKSHWEINSFSAPKESVFRVKVPEGARRAYVNFVIEGETDEVRYPEALVSSFAIEIGK